LTDQLSENGMLIIPVGTRDQQKMVRVRKVKGELQYEQYENFAFVPLLGEGGWEL
jgi:protein-L-isoaspartate(D-aspartate) O-methyltransferase